MKILLIRPINPEIKTVIPNLGLGYLATSLIKAGHQPVILDCLKENFSLTDFQKFLEKNKPFNVVGFQIFSCDLVYVKDSLKIVKKILPKAVVIAGGPHPSGTPEHTFKYFNRRIDFLFKGEAEIGLPQLLNYLEAKKIKLNSIPNLVYQKRGRIIINKSYFHTEIDDFGLPAWNLLKPQTYPPFPHGVFVKNLPTAPIITTRGCPYNCSFCAGSCISGKKIRYRSLNLVFKEIKLLTTKYHIKEIHIEDDNFTLNKNYVYDFCHRLKRENLNISWSCPNGVRIDSLDEKLLKTMKQSGCYSLALGIEAGSDKILSKMNKKLSVKQVEKAVNLCSKLGIKTTGFFIIGYPTEKAADVEKTIAFAKQLKLNRAFFANFLPYPGSPIFNDLLKNDQAGKINWRHYVSNKSSYNLHPYISNKSLRKLQKKAILTFYLRPKVIFNILKEIRSLKHLYYILIRTLVVFK